MLSIQQRSEVIDRVEHFVQLGNKLFGSSLDMPRIGFDLRGTTAGTAHYGKMELQFNAGLLVDNWEHFLEDTIPHEVAHLVKGRVYGFGRGKFLAAHGTAWKQIMLAFGVQPKRCHQMDTAKTAMPKRRYEYICPCCGTKIALSSVRHNRMLRGAQKYSHCGGTIIEFVRPLGQVTARTAYNYINDGTQQMPAAAQRKAQKPAGEPKKGTKIAHALEIYRAAMKSGLGASRQEIISALCHSMQISRERAAGYYQSCKKREEA